MTTPTPVLRDRRIIDVLTMVLLCLIVLVPFSSAYDGIDYWIAAAGGALLGGAIAYVAARWRLGILVIAALTVVAYTLFGTAFAARSQGIAGVLPTLDSLVALGTGVVQVWKRALTLTVPLDVFPGLAIAPFLLALVASVTAASLAARLRRAPAFALAPVAALLVASISFGTYEGVLPACVGAASFAISLGWAVWRRRQRQHEMQSLVDAPEDDAPRRTLPAIAALVTVIVLAGSLGGAVAAVATPGGRSVLRDEVVPPLDMHDFSSPLTLFRRYTTDGAKSTLFTVTGLPVGASIRLATLDLYDGTAYVVSGGGGAGAGSFTRVGRSIVNDAVGDAATVTVNVDSLSGVWMPTVGYLSSLHFSGEDADARNAGLHYNPVTGTAVDIDGLRSGDSYSFDAVVTPAPTDEQLVDAKISPLSVTQPERVPEAVGAALTQAAGDATTPSEQVRAVQAYLSKRGYFSNGLAGQALSRAGHGLARENDLLGAKQMVGDDEQYAVAMALMLSQLGIPSRVVMGFAPDAGQNTSGTWTVTAADVHAWVEVPFDGFGWVAFSPTPPKDRVPEEITEQQKQKPQGQVVQPPDTPQEPAQLPPAPPPRDTSSDDQGADLGWLWSLVRLGVTVLGIVLLLSAPTLVLAWARLRQRRARTRADVPADRMSGGWSEVIDQAGDVGSRVERGGTRREHAEHLALVYPQTGMRTLAARADEAVFGAAEVSDAEVDAYWTDVATARADIIRSVPWHRRLRARLWPISGARALRAAAAHLASRILRRGSRSDSRASADGSGEPTP